MPKRAKELSALEVRRLTEPGLYGVGTIPGLRLRVKDSGARNWVLRTTVAGRRAELGLGGFPAVTLAQAHEKAREALELIKSGVDPVAQRRAQRRRVAWTFKKTALAYIEVHRAGWRNAKHAAQWEATLSAYAFPIIGEKDVAAIGRGDVLAVLEPIWQTKHETASRLRSRIDLILGYAMQRELRPEGLNPARWRDNLDRTLVKGKVAKVEHFPALRAEEMHAFMQRLRAMPGMGARALEFVILTASRTGAVRLAQWSEVDMAAGIWTSPAEHMKGGRDHRVPLSPQALALLQAMPRLAAPEGQPDLIFPGLQGKPLSDMTLTACMRRMDLREVPHGFRSTFSDWAAESTAVAPEVREMALAHAIGDKTEAAYRRGDLFDKRRELMELWARFIDTPPARGNVQPIRGAA